MPDKKKITKDQLVTTHKSVHVVFFSCAHCGDEIEDIKMCPSCSQPMKVINVVEKFGEEAEKFLEQIKKNMPAKSVSDDGDDEYVSIDEEQPNIILMGGKTTVVDDGGIDPTATDDDDDGLDIIFPSDDDGEEAPPKVEALDDSELSKALEQLDEEDNTSSEEFDAFGGGEVPEL
ncbi:hypothetical protein KKA50_01330 [Patescibacteria group bacterium]|nr:hypothetical protein [Patescibacteria group bacterium]